MIEQENIEIDLLVRHTALNALQREMEVRMRAVEELNEQAQELMNEIDALQRLVVEKETTKELAATP